MASAFAPPSGVYGTPAVPLVHHEHGGGRVHALLQSFESTVNQFAIVLYGVVCEVSPLPFEWTVVCGVFLVITARAIVLWYTCDFKETRKAYVYWHTMDLIDNDCSKSYLLQHHLNTAIITYITQKLWRDAPLTAAEVKNKTFTLHMLSLYLRELDVDCEEWGYDDILPFRDRENLMLPVKLPIYPCWTPVHEAGIEVCTWISTIRVKNCYPEIQRYIYLRVCKDTAAREAGVVAAAGGMDKASCYESSGAAADAALRRFVDHAVQHYYGDGYCGSTNGGLRMYRVEPVSEKILVSGAPLPLAPTLDTVFFPKRDLVKAQLRRFTEKQGRYAIQGFPKKLGYLLYGPRGTGKRSFVRALAYYTQRHVVRIPLSRFSKNEQLFNTFYFEEARRGSTAEWKMLNSKKVIFLLEEVDTESELVRARGEAHTACVRKPRGLTTRMSTSDSADMNDAEELVINTEKRAADAGAAAVSISAPVSRPPPVLSAEHHGWAELLSTHDQKMDKINLSSLLNVLDGAIEEPDRIVVMIAEHPEVLDPALLRPGRLATHLRFDYIELEDLIRLCGLFYGVCGDDNKVPTKKDHTAGGTSDCDAGRASTRAGAPSPSCSPSSSFEIARSEITAGATTALKFPHEVAQGAARQASSGNHDLLGGADRDVELLEWQRHALQSGESARAKERVIRQLTEEQAAQVRDCVRDLETEEARARTKDGVAFNFFVTPSHAHHLCMQAESLSTFLEELAAYIRRDRL